MIGSSPARRWLAPEVVQSSAMDCGPAALGCLLAGHGVAASYDRLREACQTEVDGTSIDDLEEVARDLGLDAEQVMLPADHLFLPEAAALPALLTVVGGGGTTHFVVVWRRHGHWVQVMDPAVGRRWARLADLAAELYVHAMPVAAAEWREWATSPDFLRPLLARLAELGVPAAERRARVGEAASAAGFRALATLDAAARWVASLVAAGAVRRGREASRLLASLLAREAAAATAQRTVPAAFWSANPSPDPERLLLRGAVLVRIRGHHRASGDERLRPLTPDLARARSQGSPRPLRELFSLLAAAERRRLPLLAAAFFLVALAGLAEALLFRGLLDLPERLALPEQRATAAAVGLLFLVALLGLDLAGTAAALGVGRRVELALRLRVLDRLARMGDRYLRSRLSSDMAERTHSVWKVRLTSELAAGCLRSGFALLLTAGGIAWLDPASTPIALSSAVLAVALPFAAQAPLTERDMRLRTHAGALARFHLDALLGLVPLRNHVAARPLRREHEGLLREWARANLRLERGALVLDLATSAIGYGLAGWLVIRYLALGRGVAETLLVAYWALNIPMRGQELAILGRQLPMVRTAATRLLEPLRAPSEDERSTPPRERRPAPEGSAADAGGVALRFEGVDVVAGGRRILDRIDLALEPGTRLAVVGRSGAGKSTLIGLLLGWHPPDTGRLLVDGEPLGPARLARLRAETAWVDPAIRLWNRSLLDNVRYGAGDRPPSLSAVLDGAGLRDLLETLPDGWQTPLGEGGTLVSGGEGQRVRLARALARGPVRLVLLDEAFRGLDRATRRDLLAAVLAWWPRATVLAVSHDLEETRELDRVIVVEGGRIVEVGEPSVLARREGTWYARLLAEEHAARERFAGVRWRRSRLVNGRLEPG